MNLPEIPESKPSPPNLRVFFATIAATITLMVGCLFMPSAEAQTRHYGARRPQVRVREPSTREIALAIRALENKVRQLERRVNYLER